ncbi:hypothetical protein [Rhodococcus sp. NPDC006774]|uniref:hypothetical protein n=1 Tax=Rhodococcus sp. NPDC006774 TaxID=3157186 RepID=UPI0033CFDC7A
MPLPPSARARLAEPLNSPWRLGRRFRTTNTLPIAARPWQQYADDIASEIVHLDGLLPPGDDYVQIRDWVTEFCSRRHRIVSLLLTLEPFDRFSAARADAVVSLLDQASQRVSTAIASDAELAAPSTALARSASWWARTVSTKETSTLALAFGLTETPVDSTGEFRADWVFEHYAYRTVDLWQVITPHLRSLGVGGVTDPLAAVTIIGLILDSEDPPTSYIACDMFIRRYAASDPSIAKSARAHLDRHESAMSRARRSANEAIARAHEASADNHAESKALALAEAYKRITEGPLRQFLWVMQVLTTSEWESPPTLTPLRQRLIAGGGVLASFADALILPGLRNSEAHETLVWDGYREHFLTEDGELPPARVAYALALSYSLVNGSEAGLTAVRSLEIRGVASRLPSDAEADRLPAWRRVHAFFGTNNLRLVASQLNTRNAVLTVRALTETDINPCFQALVATRRLLPKIESFTVAVVGELEPKVVVSAAAIDSAMPSWELAVSSFGQIPLATFLPMNYDARIRTESDSLATRSVAWIAVDDVLGTFDETPPNWDSATRRMLDARLAVVALAMSRISDRVASQGPRLRSVAESISSLRQWVVDESPERYESAERQPSMLRLRKQWASWGPVPRLPLVAPVAHPGTPEPLIEFKSPPATLDYISI